MFLSEFKIENHVAKYMKKDTIATSTPDPEGKKTIWREILELVYKDREDILYKRDENGDFIYNENGFRKINVIKIIFNLAQLVSGMIVQFEMQKRLAELK